MPHITLSAKSQKGINTVQPCSIEKQKGTIAVQSLPIAPFWPEGGNCCTTSGNSTILTRRAQLLYKVINPGNSALLVLKGTSLNIVNALLALSWWPVMIPHLPHLAKPSQHQNWYLDINIKSILKTLCWLVLMHRVAICGISHLKFTKPGFLNEILCLFMKLLMCFLQS